jgi:hypothetical protein
MLLKVPAPVLTLGFLKIACPPIRMRRNASGWATDVVARKKGKERNTRSDATGPWKKDSGDFASGDAFIERIYNSPSGQRTESHPTQLKISGLMRVV